MSVDEELAKKAPDIPESPRHEPKDYHYDHRVYTAEGTFDRDGSEKKRDAWLSRHVERQIAKGKTHVCRLIPEDTLHPDMFDGTRQQRRSILRQLAKQEARGNKPCHEPKRIKPNGGKWRRLVKAMTRHR